MFTIIKPNIGKLYFTFDKCNLVDYLDTQMQLFVHIVKNKLLIKLNYYELPGKILKIRKN